MSVRPKYKIVDKVGKVRLECTTIEGIPAWLIFKSQLIQIRPSADLQNVIISFANSNDRITLGVEDIDDTYRGLMGINSVSDLINHLDLITT